MDNAALAKALTAALELMPGRDSELERLLYQVEADPSNADQRLTVLMAQLRNEPELEVFNGRMQVVGNQAGRIEYADLCDWLIRRSLKVGAGHAIEDLSHYLLSTDLPFLQTLAVSGIDPEHRCDLGHEIELLPWDQLPDSYQKKVISKESYSGLSLHFPKAALIRPIVHPRLHLKDAETKDSFRVIDNSDLHDAMLCVGLVGPSAPYILATWLSPPEWAPILRGGMSISHLEGFASLRKWPAGGCDQARKLFGAFLGLDKNRRERLRLPMERLNSAMRRVTPVNAAIDLGIALESLFLADMTDRGEWAFRLKIRAARFLGKDRPDRLRLFKLFGDLYSARSQAVHAGRVRDRFHTTPVRELLRMGFDLASQAIIRLLLEGEPDWDAITLA